jgi:hypothetical protein
MRIPLPLRQKTLALALTLVATGCSVRFNQSKDTGLTSNLGSNPFKVEARFPLNGANWNDYVNDPTPTVPFDGQDTPCSATSLKPSSCLHGGEKKIVRLPGITSCSGLTLTDELGVFDWTCNVSGGSASFYSIGVKRGKGLRDLIDPGANSGQGGWRPNSVTLTGQGAVVTSESSVWWGNTVAPLPANSGGGDSVVSLSSAGTVYFLSASRLSQGYNINADKISLVTLGTSTLRYGGSAADNCESATGTGKPTPADVRSLVCTGGQSFFWVEANLDGYHASNSAEFTFFAAEFTRHARFHRSTFVNAGTLHNLLIDGANTHSNTLTEIRTQNGGFVGLELNGTHDNIVDGLISSNNVIEGLRVFSSATSNVFQRLVLNNNTEQAINLDFAANDNLFSLITAVQNNWGFRVASTNRLTVHIAALVNQLASAVQGNTSSASATWSQLAMLNNGGYGMEVNSVSNWRGSGTLIVGNNVAGDCDVFVGTGTNPGLTDASCTTAGTEGSSGYPASSLWSNVLRPARSAAASFNGKVSGDGFNSFDAAGLSAYSQDPASVDWFGFDGPFRAFGKDGGIFPNANNTQRCASGTCRIWDFALAASDTVLQNISGNGTSQNGAPTSASCPLQARGDRAGTNGSTSPITYLLTAYEILGDEIGNDNGLCESFEACVFAPNIGAYQGSGDPLPHTCPFDDLGGTTAIKGVTLHYFPSL